LYDRSPVNRQKRLKIKEIEKMVFYGYAIDADELRMYLNGDYDIFEIVEQHDGTWLVGYIDHG